MAEAGDKRVNERPCFLCLNNLPEDQKGLFYNKEFLILCNPMPVFSGHFTIVHIIHQPQSISEHIGSVVQLMADLGSHWSVLYNGPRCGASAPDHLHFQAIPSGNMPIEREITDEKRRILISTIDGILISCAQGLGREVIILEGADPVGITGIFKQIFAELKKGFNTDNEPMMSIAGSHDGEIWRFMIFPRSKHRPDAFFREGTARVIISPAVIEMGGVLVAPVEKDFDQLDATTVEDIFGEVSLKSEAVRGIINTFAASLHYSNSQPLPSI